MRDFKRGDHLISPRAGYSHHGLYLGNNQVIHYTGFSHGRHHGVIAITSLAQFCQGESFTVQTYPFRLYSHDESADRACLRLGEDWYDVLLNNCEHFVTWCVLGIHSSHQVNQLIANVALTRKLLAAPVAETVAKDTTVHLLQHAATSTVSSANRHTTSTVAGLIAGGSVAASSMTTTAVVASVAAVSAAPVMATVGVGVAVGYGVKKLVDWIWD